MRISFLQQGDSTETGSILQLLNFIFFYNSLSFHSWYMLIRCLLKRRCVSCLPIPENNNDPYLRYRPLTYHRNKCGQLLHHTNIIMILYVWFLKFCWSLYLGGHLWTSRIYSAAVYTEIFLIQDNKKEQLSLKNSILFYLVHIVLIRYILWFLSYYFLFPILFYSIQFYSFFVRLSVCPSVRLSVCPSVCPSVRPC